MATWFTSQIVLQVPFLLRLHLRDTLHEVLVIDSGSIAAHGQHALHDKKRVK
jgi:hypothetical protein